FVENGIIVEKSDVNPNIRNGKIRTYLRTAQRPRLMWRAKAIAGRHVWADKYFGDAIIVSDEFYEQLKKSEMGSFTALECRVE
ncbi:MAG: hypothetical protein K5905_06025, partial [Roseibium sp.]|uniref:imm11 family protein n=1 Tax=Roseibium sp. TaxID=1936156 RepID=UPI00345C3EB9|nr:hypothetical protein [Roseibium sp.]